MEFKKCSRCGGFYTSEGQVCQNCAPKENCEYSAFKSYVEANGTTNPLYDIAGETGISTKHINRFIATDGLDLPTGDIGKKGTGFNGITFN